VVTNNSFNYQLSTNLLFGAGASEELGNEVRKLSYQRAAIIIDQGVFEHQQVIKAIEGVKTCGISYEIFKNEAVEPTYGYLESFKKNFLGQKPYDCLIGIGGGSALDLTKGIAILLTNEGRALLYRGFPQLKNRPLPVIAVPTTAGTGSEVTYNAVFTEENEKKKLGINSRLNFPARAIIDPLITVNCPKTVTVSSGCDALVHSLESFAHKKHSPFSRMHSKEAFYLLFNNLMKVLDDPANIEIRANLALGAYLAGIALMNSGSGPAGAFSYPLGAVYKVAHGYAGAVFTPGIVKMNVRKGYSDYSLLYDLIEGADKSFSPARKNQEFARQIQLLMDKLEVVQKLSNFGLTKKDIDFMIEQYDGLKAAIDQNPIEISKKDISELIYELA